MSGRPRGERQRGPLRRPLLLEEVEAAGLPAFFTSFGDRLVYRDGSVYSLPSALEPAEVAQLEKLPGAYAVTQRVGIEYPWLHSDSCGCRFCAPDGELEIA
jgi:hypothetical protein